MYRLGTLHERRTDAQQARRVRKVQRREIRRAPRVVRDESRVSLVTRAKAWFASLRIQQPQIKIAPRCQFVVEPSKKNPQPAPCGGRLRRVNVTVDGRIVVQHECKTCGRRVAA